LRQSVRHDDLVARLGGDEFVILLENPAAGGAESVAAKIVQAMHAPVDAGGVPIHLSTSIGIARARRPDQAATLLARADAALYVAKHAGRNRYHVAADDPGAGDGDAGGRRET